MSNFALRCDVRMLISAFVHMYILAKHLCKHEVQEAEIEGGGERPNCR